MVLGTLLCVILREQGLDQMPPEVTATLSHSVILLFFFCSVSYLSCVELAYVYSLTWCTQNVYHVLYRLNFQVICNFLLYPIF